MFLADQTLFFESIHQRLLSSLPTQTFQTQNRAGFYQICSNGKYIIADDWCQNYKGHRLSQSMRCLTIYNQYEEQCLLMLPEFHTLTPMDSIQSITWHERLNLFLFITYASIKTKYLKKNLLLCCFIVNRYYRVYQCEPESGSIHQINEYEIPSPRHSLTQIACDDQSSIFLAYQYPTAILDLWKISSLSTWSLIKRWKTYELFYRTFSEYGDDYPENVCKYICTDYHVD